MSRILAFLYGLAAYVAFLGVFLYLVGFLANVLVPKSIDSGEPGPWQTALLINVALLALFGLQHTAMARPTFKRWWTRFVPRSIERSTYLMATNVVLVLLYWWWQPMLGVVWQVEQPVGSALLWTLFGFGWLLVLVATFMINHFDLFGLRQIWLHLRGEDYQSLNFATPWLYRIVRHPLYVGWLIAFWAAPTMTVGHLVFALGNTVYILIAIYFEERNLHEYYGQPYADYRRRVPMLIPNPFRQRGHSGDSPPTGARMP